MMFLDVTKPPHEIQLYSLLCMVCFAVLSCLTFVISGESKLKGISTSND